MTIDFHTIDYMAQLRKVGLRPSEKLVQRINALGEGAIAPLLNLALDSELVNAAEEGSFAPVHALRLLGELHSTTIIEPLLDAFPIDQGLAEEEGNAAELWDNELAQILGSLGAPAIAPLFAYADNTEKTLAARSTAMTAIAYATAVAPEEHAAAVAGLKERLEATDDILFATHILMAICNIGAPELYSFAMGLYKENKIERDVLPPGTARQLLLSSSTKRLACAKHPLWERYDQHGPFPRNPYGNQ